MPANNNQIEKRLWSAADELRANSKMRAADSVSWDLFFYDTRISSSPMQGNSSP